MEFNTSAAALRLGTWHDGSQELHLHSVTAESETRQEAWQMQVREKDKWHKVQSPTQQQTEWFGLQATENATFGNTSDFGQ